MSENTHQWTPRHPAQERALREMDMNDIDNCEYSQGDLLSVKADGSAEHAPLSVLQSIAEQGWVGGAGLMKKKDTITHANVEMTSVSQCDPNDGTKLLDVPKTTLFIPEQGRASSDGGRA